MAKKTETLNLRVTPELKELLRRAALDEHRTVSNLLEVLVREHCARRGLLNETPRETPASHV
jgi:uncharacterized protein (DUF1778 family)